MISFYPSAPTYLLDPRELRLRRRIDSLLASRAAKEARILQLEELLRVDGGEERIAVLEGRLNRARWRLIELSEELREERAARVA